MSVTVVKQKEKAKKTEHVSAAMLKKRALADEIGALDKKIKAFHKTTVEHFETRKAELLELVCDEIKDHESATVRGDKYEVEVSALPEMRLIKDLKKVRALMGDEVFMQVATVTLKSIDDYLTPDEKAKVLDTVRKGSRRCKVTAIT